MDYNKILESIEEALEAIDKLTNICQELDNKINVFMKRQNEINKNIPIRMGNTKSAYDLSEVRGIKR